MRMARTIQNSNSKSKMSTVTPNQSNHHPYGESYKKSNEVHKIKLECGVILCSWEDSIL